MISGGNFHGEYPAKVRRRVRPVQVAKNKKQNMITAPPKLLFGSFSVFKAADFLAIGVAELGNISERRLERLVNPVISGLPAFLAQVKAANSSLFARVLHGP